MVLSRDPEKARRMLPERCEIFKWTPHMEIAPERAFDGVWGIINLVGETIVGRWTHHKKQEMRNSRIVATKHLVQILNRLHVQPSVIISASAVGIYGHRKDTLLYENSTTGLGFLSNLCRDWESEANEAKDLSIRTIILRIGIVLGHGGFLNKMLPAYRFGLGGKLGAGDHWMSWIHMQDLVSIFLYALEHEEIKGVYNAVSPSPVKQVEFSKTLAKVIHRPAFLRIPALFLKKGLGEFGRFMLMSQRVSSQKLEKSGFSFRYADLKTALKDICG